mgnify:CR=1 FL=1
MAYGTLYPIEVSGLGATIRYKTDITVGLNGQESRNAAWQDPLMAYDASFLVRTLEDARDLQTFFHGAKGAEQSFLIKDVTDFQIERTNIGTGNGAATTFQLIKIYSQGILPNYSRTITKPKAVEGVGGVRVWVNNVELSTSAFSFSSTTGIITLSSAPANGHAVEASCDEYYVPVRFESDELPIDVFQYLDDDSGLVNLPNQRLLEVRGE